MKVNFIPGIKLIAEGTDSKLNLLSSFQMSLYNKVDSIDLRINPKIGCFHDGVAFPEKYLA